MPPQETALPGEAIRVVMGEDGRLHFGRAGRIRVDASFPAFFTAVSADLVRIAATVDGRRRVDGEMPGGHPIRIEKPPSPTVPPNAWALPDDLAAAIAAGAGCGTTIFYDPTDWPNANIRVDILDLLLRQADMNATGTADSPADAATSDRGEPGAALRLTCRPGKSGNRLTFAYALHNDGPGDVYVMDALPDIDPGRDEPRASEQPAVVILRPDGDVMLGRFLAPSPIDRRLAVPVIPLARRLSAGADLERQLDVVLPLAETSPYFPDLTLRSYEPVDVKGVVFTIGYWAAGDEGVLAGPVDYASGLYVIGTRNAARAARRVSQRFATTALQLFKRTDAFPRPAN